MYSNLIHLFNFGTGKKVHLLGCATYGTTKYVCMHACMDEYMNIKHYMRHIILMSHMCNDAILMSLVCYVVLMSHVYYYIHLHESCFMVITFMENIKKALWKLLGNTQTYCRQKNSGKTCFYIRKISFLKFFS
jgi:hypothetical protein